ncbi:MAG TPA: protein kinase [Myxococcaceae bacterium]|nr:protein kinase [Myxococcaceae bacterium]
MTTPQGVIPLTQPIAHPPLVRFDKYILVRKLAEGGMAEIFLAKQVGAEGFERDVVLKLMLGHLSSSREFVEMFLDEARLAAKLHHPNIVQISDLGHFNGRYFICMEYLPGEDLQSMVEVAARTQKAVPFGVAARIVHSACEGLEFAHTYAEHGQPLGVVHRDVSPSNIIVTYQGLVKVLDFGIAKAGSKLTQTQPGLLKGKWGYMSPEQARGDPIDNRSDLFSLGITFHELLTGQRVFRKDNEIGVLLALMQQPIPAPSSVRRDIPHALDRIVMKALEKQPEHRYPDAGAFRADLEAYLATTSQPGMSTLAAYMVALFGREQMAERTQIPTLRELSAFMGDPQEPPPGPAPLDRVGTDPTMVRKATPAHPQPAPRRSQPGLPPLGQQIGAQDVQPDAATIQLEIPPHELLAQRRALEERARGGSGWRWAFAALLVGCLAGGGYGGYAYLRMHPERLNALLGRQPPPPPPPPTPPTPIEVVATPVPPTPPPPVETPTPTPPVEPPTPVAMPPKRERPVLLTTRDLSQMLVRARPQMNACFQHNQPKTGNKLDVELSIANSGAVKSARVVTAGLETGPLAECISRTLKALRFPRNTNNPPVAIRVPYSYGPGP